MEEIYLSDFFTTKAQANDFSARLSAIAEKIYEVDFNLENILQEQLGTQKKDKFMSLLRENKISINSDTALNLFFGKIQNTLSSLPIATLTLAIDPPEQTLKAISDWFVLNMNRQVLLQIEIDPDIIAGAAVSYKGKHLNASIKPVLDDACAEVLSKKKS